MILLAIVFLGPASDVVSERKLIDEPLEQALKTKIECIEPDHKAKSCTDIVHYSVDEGGETTITLTSPINNEPDFWVIMDMHIFKEKNAICSLMTESQVKKMRLLVDGEPDNGNQYEEILTSVRGRWGGFLLNKKICSQYYRALNGRIFTKTFIDGRYYTFGDSEVSWRHEVASYSLKAEENMITK